MRDFEDKYSVALDIGASKVALLVGLHEPDGKIRIVAGTSVPIEEGSILRGEVTNMNSVTQAIRKAIDTIENEDRIRINSATIGVTGRTLVVEDVRENVYVRYDDEITQQDIDLLKDTVSLRKPKEDHFVVDIILHEYDIDGRRSLKDPLGMVSNKLYGNFSILSAPNTLRSHINKMVSRVGIDMAELVPFAIASAEAVLTEEDKELGVCLVDLGATTTEIAIYQDSRLRFAKSLPYGVSLLNADIKTYGIMHRFVESIKVQFGEALPEYTPDNTVIEIPVHNRSHNRLIPQRTISKIIECRMSEIIRVIKDVIDSSGYNLSEGIVITGGGSKLKNVDRLFKNRTNYITRVGVPNSRVLGLENIFINDPRYATAIGILLKAYDMNSFSDIEFLEEVEEKPVAAPKREERRSYRDEMPKGGSKRGLFSRRKEEPIYEEEEYDEGYDDDYDEGYEEEDENKYYLDEEEFSEESFEERDKGQNKADKFFGNFLDKLMNNN